MKMTKTKLREFRTDFEKSVSNLEKQYGISIKLGSISYTDNQFSSKMTCIDQSESTQGEVVTKEALDFAKYCYRYGLRPSDLGRTVETPSGDFTIIGLKPSATKYPILGKNKLTGQIYKLPAYVTSSIK